MSVDLLLSQCWCVITTSLFSISLLLLNYLQIRESSGELTVCFLQIQTNKKGGSAFCYEHVASYLVSVQDFQKGFVNVWLTLKAILDLIDIIYSVVKLHWLVVLQRRTTGWRAADRSVGLN